LQFQKFAFAVKAGADIVCANRGSKTNADRTFHRSLKKSDFSNAMQKILKE
jgi:hypothetical protein